MSKGKVKIQNVQKANSYQLRKSLRFSFWDGVFASIMTGLTSEYLSPYALSLKAGPRVIGALTAFPFLVSSLLQLKSADITEKIKSRKKVINIFVLLHAFMLVPIMLIPFWIANRPLLYLVIFATCFTGFNALAVPVWLALMSEYIPSQSRGKYFGWRNKIMLSITIASSLFAGLILHIFRKDVFRGFLIIFSIAFFSRLISWYFLNQMFEPKFKIKQEAIFSFWDFIKNIKRSNFTRFVLFVSALQFSVHLAAPFFSVFMLQDLRFSYLTYTILVTAVTVTQVVVIDRWGRIADKIGNIKVLKITALVIASLPLWWLFYHNPAYLFFAQLLSGFAWAGFNLCAINFIYDAVTSSKRIRCIGYFNVFVGVAIFFGSIIGGYLARIVPVFLGFKMHTLFILSSLMRFLIIIMLVRKISEVRSTKKLNIKEVFSSLIGLRAIPE